MLGVISTYDLCGESMYNVELGQTRTSGIIFNRGEAFWATDIMWREDIISVDAI